MKNLFLRLISIAALPSCIASCVKTVEEQPMQFEGRWAKIENHMTSEYIEFKADILTKYVSDEKKTVMDGTIWNSARSDFKEVMSGQYSVRDGIISVSGTELGKISFDGDNMTIGNDNYCRFYKFNGQFYNTISVQEIFECDYRAQSIGVCYKIAIPVQGAELYATSTSDWITDLSVTEGNISFDVLENNSGNGRESAIRLEYAGAEPRTISVIQSYSQSEIIVSPDFEITEEGGPQSIPVKIINPREDTELSVSCDADWIRDLKTEDGTIRFNAGKNTSGNIRETLISMDYKSAESRSVRVRQSTDLSEYTDLSADGTANCYIVSSPGTYMIPAIKGNSNEIIEFSSAEVIWESFGTSQVPQKGDLIKSISSAGTHILFSATSAKGNAVIAAKDNDGNILWSWHIWMTDRPEEQSYNNGAGTVLDRNLGATSSEPGNIGTYGLFYQWGRKDPFLGSAVLYSVQYQKAGSTITWPVPEESTATTGTIGYTIAHPTTFISTASTGKDWYYSKGNPENSRWMPEKTIYDPCPPGYRVPDGGEDGIWATALETSPEYREDTSSFDNDGKGFNFGSSGNMSKKLSGQTSVCWYPSAGYLNTKGSLYNIGYAGYYWSCTPHSEYANRFYARDFHFFGKDQCWIYPAGRNIRTIAASVRCVKEGE